jgi:bla regulator protein blaR1
VRVLRLMSALLWVPSLMGQSPATFEVASVRRDDPLNPGTSIHFQPGGGIKIAGASLRSLILFAYDLRDFQLSGTKGWMNSERYVILAKGTIDDGADDFRRMNDRQNAAMAALIRKRMQALLAERFQLAVHTQTKELPLYALVVAKGGHKLQPNNAPDGSSQGMSAGRGMLKGTRVSPEFIAQALAGSTGRIVRDETGLTGFYDFKMEWTPDGPAVAPDKAADKAEERAAALVGPTIYTALQEQLGLKLEAKKGPVDILIVDHAERPSEN